MWVFANGCCTSVSKNRIQVIFQLFFASSAWKENKIKWGVLIGHGVIILSLCMHHFFSEEKKRSHIVVRTIKPSLVASAKVSSPIGATETKSSPKPKKPAEKKKVVEPKKEVKKPPEKVIKPIEEKEPSPSLAPKKKEVVTQEKMESSLLKEMEEQFAELEKPKVSVPKILPLAVPSIPDHLQVVSTESGESREDPRYGDLLVAYLQSMLSLPEQGVVKIELEVDGLGLIIRCDVIEAKSQKNSDFLKKQLPELNLPCFNGKPNETFICTILFKNL
jgi:hypothetical protein